MKTLHLSALLAAAVILGDQPYEARAADLGGNCCSDLEERVAELEATTVRKGNRKVSLTVSGWVAEQVTWWDDGVEDNTYVTGLGSTLASNVKFTGQATIVPGWTAGYVIHIEADGSDSLTTNQENPDGPGLFAGTQKLRPDRAILLVHQERSLRQGGHRSAVVALRQRGHSG